MNRKTDNSSTINVISRCQHRTGNGRCRMPVAEPSTSLCVEHSRTSREAVAAELLGSIQQFDSAEAVNLFLSNLLIQLTNNRIGRRDAIALAYISQLLLNSLPALDRQHEAGQKDADRRQLNADLKAMSAVYDAHLATRAAKARLTQKAPVSPPPLEPQDQRAPVQPQPSQPAKDYASVRT